MKKTNELMREVTELVKETKAGKIKWKIDVSTTEYNRPEDKVTIIDNGTKWTSDECFVSYNCQYKGEEFLMITYEMINSADKQKKTTNLVFLPPLGVRVFDLHTLLPYSVKADQMLIYNVHMLWLTVLEEQKTHPELITIEASERMLTLDEDRGVKKAEEEE